MSNAYESTCNIQRTVGIGFCRSCQPKDAANQKRNCDNCQKIAIIRKISDRAHATRTEVCDALPEANNLKIALGKILDEIPKFEMHTFSNDESTWSQDNHVEIEKGLERLRSALNSQDTTVKP